MKEGTALSTTDTMGLGYSGGNLPSEDELSSADAGADAADESRFLRHHQREHRTKRQIEMSQEAAEAFGGVLLRSVDWHAVDRDAQKVGRALGALKQATDPVRRQLSAEVAISPVLFEELMKAQEDMMAVVTEALGSMKGIVETARKTAH